MHRLKMLAVWLVVAAAAIVSGSFLGGKYSRWRADAEAVAQIAELQSYLDKHIKGIAVDERFPEVPFWSSDGSEAYHIADLLPDGGVAIYIVAECGACIKTLDNLAVAQTLLKGSMLPTVVLVGGDASKAAMELAARGVQIPAFSDTQESLVNEHGVVAFPAYFRLSESQVVMAYGPLQHDSDELIEILRR